jgi:hypothetical protein
MNIHSSNVESPLLNPSSPTSDTQLPLRDLLSNTSLRGPTLLCAVIMALQQFGGINAVMFYSTPVLRPLLPNAAGLLGIGITLVNAIMTLPAIFLVDVSPLTSIQIELRSSASDEDPYWWALALGCQSCLPSWPSVSITAIKSSQR